MYFKILLITIAFATAQRQNDIPSRPNIVLILADDMGFNDVSFHGSNQFITPNIDALAYNGMILNNYYVPALCTPSRATLLTGKYPIHTGMQHYVIPNYEPWGLPLKEKIMPEIFKEAGYSTNLVGKWHLGFFNKNYTPTLRGFDYHFGYYGGYIGYYDHSLEPTNTNFSKGYDFRKNLHVTYEGNNTYATDVFTDESVRVIMKHNESEPLFLMVTHLAVHAGNDDNPFEAPDEEIAKFKYINDPNRRMYAAMVSRLDQSVGKIVQALSDKGILENSIIIFYSDNGAPTYGIHANQGSNFPLRGQKHTPWEGGIRIPALIYSSLLKQKNSVFNQTIYAADWLPTLAAAAQIKTDLPNIDGINFWEQLINNSEKKERSIVHNIDDIIGYASYMRGPWKYVKGSTDDGSFDSWLGNIGLETDPRSLNYAQEIRESEVGKILSSHSILLSNNQIETLRKTATVRCPNEVNMMTKKHQCVAMYESCLFHIENDPCEQYNLAHTFPEILKSMASDIDSFRKTAVKPARVNYADPNSDPALHNYTWSWWKTAENKSNSKYSKNFMLICLLTLGIKMSNGILIST